MNILFFSKKTAINSHKDTPMVFIAMNSLWVVMSCGFQLHGNVDLVIMWPMYNSNAFIPAWRSGAPDHHWKWSITTNRMLSTRNPKPAVRKTNDNDQRFLFKGISPSSLHAPHKRPPIIPHIVACINHRNTLALVELKYKIVLPKITPKYTV